MNSAQKYTEKKEDQRKFKKLWERIYFYNNYTNIKITSFTFLTASQE